MRPANHIERRIMEAAKLGFSHVIVPAIHAPTASGRLANIDIIKCRTIKDALTVGPSLSHASYSVTAKCMQDETLQMDGDGKVGPHRLSYSIANDSSPYVREWNSRSQVYKRKSAIGHHVCPKGQFAAA